VVANGYCAQPNENTPSLWYNQVQDLVTYLHDNTSFGTSSMLYFEIGNEPDFQQTGDKRSGQVGLYTDGTSFTSTDGSYHYEDVFAYAARGLQQALSSKGYTRYRILTAGMFIPSANINKGACQSTKAGDAGNNNSQDVFAAGLGIAEAEASYPAGYVPPPGVPMYSGPAVPATHLGLGVHPYGYNSSGGYWWRNEYRKTDALGRRIRPGTSCSNIDILTRTWSGTGKDFFYKLRILSRCQGHFCSF